MCCASAVHLLPCCSCNVPAAVLPLLCPSCCVAFAVCLLLCCFCCVPAAVLPLLQGRLGAALRYLEMVPGEASTSVAVLKDRIYRCV